MASNTDSEDAPEESEGESGSKETTASATDTRRGIPKKNKVHKNGTIKIDRYFLRADAKAVEKGKQIEVFACRSKVLRSPIGDKKNSVENKNADNCSASRMNKAQTKSYQVLKVNRSVRRRKSLVLYSYRGRVTEVEVTMLYRHRG